MNVGQLIQQLSSLPDNVEIMLEVGGDGAIHTDRLRSIRRHSDQGITFSGEAK